MPGPDAWGRFWGDAVMALAVNAVLHRLMEPLPQVVQDKNGTIDKATGDCLTAIWNAPLDVTDHAARAVASARQMIATRPR